MKHELAGRKFEINESKIEIGEGAEIISATYADGTELNERELEAVTDLYQDELYRSGMEDKIADAYDRAKEARKYGDD
jgi:hypothetical protein